MDKSRMEAVTRPCCIYYLYFESWLSYLLFRSKSNSSPTAHGHYYNPGTPVQNSFGSHLERSFPLDQKIHGASIDKQDVHILQQFPYRCIGLVVSSKAGIQIQRDLLISFSGQGCYFDNSARVSTQEIEQSG